MLACNRSQGEEESLGHVLHVGEQNTVVEVQGRALLGHSYQALHHGLKILSLVLKTSLSAEQETFNCSQIYGSRSLF
jgi:hypothetical protein